VPLLVGERGAEGVVEVADALFREAVAFGVLASGHEILVEQLELYLPRAVGLAAILAVAEPAGLAFGNEAFPYWPNSEQWSPSLPLAGFTSSTVGPRPSQVLASLTDAWLTALAGPSRSARHSLLLAVLSYTRDEGLWPALELAIELAGSGYLLNPTDLEAVVTLLLGARNAVGSDAEMVSRLLGGVDLESTESLVSGSLTTDWVVLGQPTSPAVGSLVERILRSLMRRAADARGSSGLDEWVLNQQRLFNAIGPLLRAIRSVMPQMPLPLEAVMTNLSEIGADAGGFCGTIKLNVAGDPSYGLLVQAALPVMFEFRRRIGEGWEERLCRERVLVPDELRPLMLEIEGDWPAELSAVVDPRSPFTKAQIASHDARCPRPWKELSYALAHPFVCVMRPERRGPELVRGASSLPPDLSGHPLVVEMCARHGATTHAAVRESLARASRSRPSRFLTDRDRLLLGYVWAVAAGTAPIVNQIDLTAGFPAPGSSRPAELDDDLVQAVAAAAAELNGALLRQAMSGIVELLARDEPADAVVPLIALKLVLPWSAEICDALAAAFCGTGDFRAARGEVQASLQLQARQGERWRLLATLLAHEPDTKETVRLAEAIAELWA